jgi:hypothetical protein
MCPLAHHLAHSQSVHSLQLNDHFSSQTHFKVLPECEVVFS